MSSTMLAADAVHEPGQSIVLKDRQALRGSCPQRATASRSGLFGSARPQHPKSLSRRQSSASPDHGEDGQHHSHPRIRQGDQRPTAGTARLMRGGHFCPCGGRPEHRSPAPTVPARHRVRDRQADRHRRSRPNREIAASRGGRNRA